MLVACKDVQAKYIIRGLQGKMRIGLTATTAMGEAGSACLGSVVFRLNTLELFIYVHTVLCTPHIVVVFGREENRTAKKRLPCGFALVSLSLDLPLFSASSSLLCRLLRLHTLPPARLLSSRFLGARTCRANAPLSTRAHDATEPLVDNLAVTFPNLLLYIYPLLHPK